MKGRRMGALESLTFEDWLEHAFGREVRFQRPPWFFDSDADWWNPKAGTAIDFLTRLFQSPAVLTAQFSDDQIAQGLTYLLNTGAVGDNGWFYSSEVAPAARKACISATFNLFSEIFQPRCAPVLGHLSKVQTAPLNTVAYMFWEGFPCVALPGDAHRPELQLETLGVMQRILSLESVACVESALHGLGHAHASHPGQVEQIIDRYLANPSCAGPEIDAYARAARCGCVL